MTPHLFHIGPRDAGRDLGGWLKVHLRLPWRDLQELIRAGRIFVDGKPCVDPDRRLRNGQRVEARAAKIRSGPKKENNPSNHVPPEFVLDPSCLVYLDASIVVVNKPPGVTTMRHKEDIKDFGSRAKRFLPPTLADLLPALIVRRDTGKPRQIRAVHRLDKETTGLVVFARTVEAESKLGKQFRAHTIERVYRALVRGRAVDARIESRMVADRGDGRRGSTTEPDEGQVAITRVRVVETLGDFTLIECQLETGRTHQIRIHLGEAGTPLCGDRLYDRPLHGRPLPDASGMKRVALHGAVLGFDHPETGERIRWEARLSKDIRDAMQRLRERTAKKT